MHLWPQSGLQKKLLQKIVRNGAKRAEEAVSLQEKAPNCLEMAFFAVFVQKGGKMAQVTSGEKTRGIAEIAAKMAVLASAMKNAGMSIELLGRAAARIAAEERILAVKRMELLRLIWTKHPSKYRKMGETLPEP